MNPIRPPQIAKMILKSILNHNHPETMIGDFEEIYHEIAHKKSIFRAKLWFWLQILLTLPSFVKNSVYWGITMFANYLKVALRVIKKNKFFSFINIAGLAVGMACCFLTLFWVQDELGYDRFHKNFKDLYRLTMNFEGRWSSQTPWALARTLQNEYPEVQFFTRFRTASLIAGTEKTSFYEDAAFVDPDFFHMFTFPFVNGSAESVFPTVQSAVITERTAKKYFGTDDPMGKVLMINAQNPFTIAGVLRDLPSNSHLNVDILLPVRLLGEETLNSWAIEADSYIMLEKNASPKNFQEKISGIIMKYDKRVEHTMIAGIQPLSRIHLYSLRGGGGIIHVYIFSIVAAIVLLLACINFINLSTARGSTRGREVGLRKVVGAKRSQIVKQFIWESILLSHIAFLFGAILVWLFLPAFNNLTQKSVSLSSGNILIMFFGIIIILIITGIASGSYPAFYLSAYLPVKILKGSVSPGNPRTLLRKALVVFHFAVTISLLIATSMMMKQLHFIRSKELGYNRQHVIALPFNSAVNSSYDAFKDEILQSTSVLNVSAASSLPVNASNMNPVYWEGRGPDNYEPMMFATVDYDYIKTFEMEITQGRDFSPDLLSDRQNYIVNEEAVKFMGLEDPVGKLFSIWENEGRIIGVIKNFHSRPLSREIEPLALTLNREWDFRYVFIRIKPVGIPGTLAELEETWKKFAPNYPFRFRFMDEEFERYYTAEQRMERLLKYFTFLAVFISCLGILGLSSYLAEQRTKEIGVRKVLGATITNIVGIISREFTYLLVFANLVAWPAAYFIVHRMMKGYAYRTGISWWVFVLAGAIAFSIALITVSLQAVRAARANPANSLRHE